MKLLGAAKRFLSNAKTLLVLLVLFVFGWFIAIDNAFVASSSWDPSSDKGPSYDLELKTALTNAVKEKLDVESTVKFGELNINYKTSEIVELRKYIKKIISRYRPDYASVVIIDNNDGSIISMVDYNRKKRSFSRSLSLSSTHPAASLIKVITATELIESGKLEETTPLRFNGRSTTLYKYQFKERLNRWTRVQTFKKAFALSNNILFGKSAIKNIRGQDFHNRAERFGFNKDLTPDLLLAESFIGMPQSEYHLAELASGLNRQTQISPLHGAVLASIVANDGKLIRPKLFKKLSLGDKVVNLKSDRVDQVMDAATAETIKEMMQLTVEKGTARGSFKKFMRKHNKTIEVGGKTGSITGGVPFGKRDWFIAYARNKNDPNDKGISICAMNVNVKKWYVKSAFLVSKVIEKYFSMTGDI